MTLTVDPRRGSEELIKPLRRLLTAPVVSEQLEYGDCAWVGNGPEDKLIPIGLEYKKLGDLLQVIRDQRFSGHQLPGLWASYQVVYLLIEADIKRGDRGELLHRKPGSKSGKWSEIEWTQKPWTYGEVAHWLATMRNRGGVVVLRSRDLDESAALVAHEYTWWTRDEFEAHKAHLAFYEPPPKGPDPRLFVRPSRVARFAAQLDGVGYERAFAVSGRFKTPREMVNAPEKEWREIEGIGKVLAKSVQEQLDGK